MTQSIVNILPLAFGSDLKEIRSKQIKTFYIEKLF